jgi:hypothetical protein
LIETACIPCLYKPAFGTELGKSSSAAFSSQTTLPKLVFTDCWDWLTPTGSSARVSRVSWSSYACLAKERITRIIHNQARTRLLHCVLLGDSGPGDITFGRNSLRLMELSQSKSGCGNRCAKAKPPLCAAGTSRDIVHVSLGVIL